MLTASPCEHCGGSIEYESENWTAATRVPCPHCERETALTPPIRDIVQAVRPAANSLTHCPSCGHQISVRAAVCPKCGHQHRAPGSINPADPIHIIGLIVCGIILLGVLIMLIRAFAS